MAYPKFVCNPGDTCSTSGSGRSPGEVNGNPLQYSCLGNPMDREVWQATVNGVPGVGYELAIKKLLVNILLCRVTITLS